MGLCKCPKRKVTNQFCFEHRVNVCEHCMVSNHPKCVVQSYLQWLKDSDYSSVCTLCSSDLSNSDCIRLVCYHVFHLSCLDSYAKQLPANTAPAGYCCPTCSTAIFPKKNLVSPIADKLRAVLAKRSWAREGLGLPLLPVGEENEEEALGAESDSSMNTSVSTDYNQELILLQQKKPPSYSVVQMETSQYLREDSSKRSGITSRDHDEDKYKRRSAVDAIKRLITNALQANPRTRRFGLSYRRYVILCVAAVLGLVLLFAIFSRIIRTPDLSDFEPEPFLKNH
nr:EOG090X0ASS [Eulimnadia texana]